jgi:hypothetical protein
MLAQAFTAAVAVPCFSSGQGRRAIFFFFEEHSSRESRKQQYQHIVIHLLGDNTTAVPAYRYSFAG